MAKEQAKLEIDTGLDLSGFKKGYSKLNKELIKAQSDIAREAGKVTKAWRDNLTRFMV
jgi:hypothetical protein